jgi:hypothetical protein
MAQNRNTNRQPAKQQVVRGRRVFDLPGAGPIDYRESLRRQQAENDKLKAENARQAKELAQANEQNAEAIWRYVNLETVVALNCRALKLGEKDARRLDNFVENVYRKHKAEGKDFKKFDPYAAISTWKANRGHAVRVPKQLTGLDHALPPPNSGEGHARKGTLPGLQGDEAAHRTAYDAAQARGAKLRRDEQDSRDHYQRRLRELGLQDPNAGISVAGNCAALPGRPGGET